MDFQVEATIHLSYFRDKTEVLQILRSHDFVMAHLSGNKLRIKGWFVDLKSAKAHLERLLEASNPTDVYSSPHHPGSSGAVPKNHCSGTSEARGTRNRSGSRNKLPHASASSPSTSLLLDSPHSHPPSAGPDQRGSVSQGHQTLVVEGDVFRYAERVMREELHDIKDKHNVVLRRSEVGESFHITLEGRKTKEAAGELQRLLKHLHTSLRTQEVPRMDIGPKGHAVLQRIQENGYVYNSVLVCEMHDRLHLIGPSVESYQLKQTLLESSGWTSHRGSRRRSSSLPASSRRHPDKDAKPPPHRAAGEREGAGLDPRSVSDFKMSFNQMLSRFKGRFIP